MLIKWLHQIVHAGDSTQDAGRMHARTAFEGETVDMLDRRRTSVARHLTVIHTDN